MRDRSRHLGRPVRDLDGQSRVSNLRCHSRRLERVSELPRISDDPSSVSGAIGGYAIVTLVPRIDV